jgi:hypothetical protein
LSAGIFEKAGKTSLFVFGADRRKFISIFSNLLGKAYDYYANQ